MDGKDIVDINQGCPQGSRLSPLFFILYINELIQDLKKILTDPLEDIYAFADDIAVICKELRQVNKIIDCLKKAEKNWGIMINPKKSAIMKICKRNPKKNENRYRDIPFT